MRGGGSSPRCAEEWGDTVGGLVERDDDVVFDADEAQAEDHVEGEPAVPLRADRGGSVRAQVLGSGGAGCW